VDQTGLKGKYDFYLKWTSTDVPSSDPGAPPVLLTALREQLGLNIEAARAPVDVLAVTHVERSSGN
jgi:uncharacterized protein (TIGR03435 family)